MDSTRQATSIGHGDTRSDVRLNIGIVGAGIAGLAAAATLTRAGHNVDVGADQSQ